MGRDRMKYAVLFSILLLVPGFLSVGAPPLRAGDSSPEPGRMSTEDRAKARRYERAADGKNGQVIFGTGIPAPFCLSGEDTDQIFSGNSFLIDGHDVNPDGSPGPGPDVPGIVVSSPLTMLSLIDELDQEGTAGLVRGTGGSLPSIELSPFGVDVQVLFDEYSPRATITFDPKAGEYFFFGMPVTWGTPEEPKVVWVRDDVNVFGSLEGAGVLILESELDLNGSFRWEGLILIMEGGFLNHSLERTGGVGEVFGAVATGARSGAPEMMISGDLRVQYSTLALNRLDQVPLRRLLH